MIREGIRNHNEINNWRSIKKDELFLGSSKNIKFPALWLGHLINGRPIPWLHFPIEGIILNAFELYEKKKVYLAIKSGKCLRDLLPDPGKTLISLDSGGFLFQKKPEIKLPFSDFISIIRNAKPDFVYSLDHPLDPNISQKDNNKRIQKTLKNLKEIVSTINSVKVVPILHGYTPSQLEYCANGIRKLYGENPDFLACGSLVPLMRTAGKIIPSYLKIWDTSSRRIMVLRILKLAKSLFPKSKLHVFGIGGTNIMHLMYLIADSVDSIGWRWSAAGGMVRILEVGERYISGREKSVRWNPNLNKEDWNVLSHCNCPVCLENQDLLKNSFEARAIHNAFVYQEETRIARERIQNGTYYIYLKKRMAKNNTIKNLIQEFDCIEN